MENIIRFPIERTKKFQEELEDEGYSIVFYDADNNEIPENMLTNLDDVLKNAIDTYSIFIGRELTDAEFEIFRKGFYSGFFSNGQELN